MDSRSEISSFLTSRRARLSPEDAGVPLHGPGLRREEVAQPGSATAEAVRLLGSWAAPSHRAQEVPGPAAEQQRRT
ncbi:hypothetical protein [Streptomyces sp. enrichment culture]|uniref:hypothetical protein n=1 Tax=Streptomyces sp. enrichment culture TaxID=1795815 RepID=UPI003F55F40F